MTACHAATQGFPESLLEILSGGDGGSQITELVIEIVSALAIHGIISCCNAINYGEIKATPRLKFPLVAGPLTLVSPRWSTGFFDFVYIMLQLRIGYINVVPARWCLCPAGVDRGSFQPRVILADI